MGQAKRRGTLEQRLQKVIEARMIYEERAIAEIVKELGLPDASVFMGYVIHNEVKDDYLFEISVDGAARKYCSGPENALKYEKFEDALAVVIRINKGLIIGRLFDAGDRYAVGFCEVKSE